MTLEERQQFQLSSADADFLLAAAWLPIGFREKFSASAPRSGAVSVLLTRSEAEDLGGHLTERLATVGFDGSYELTSEGRLLESLIDAFIWR